MLSGSNSVGVGELVADRAAQIAARGLDRLDSHAPTAVSSSTSAGMRRHVQAAFGLAGPAHRPAARIVAVGTGRVHGQQPIDG